MSRADVKTASLWTTPPDAALVESLSQHAGKPSAPANDTVAAARKQATTTCVTYGFSFVPMRKRYRKCQKCAADYKATLVEHAKRRDADGSTVFRLLTHLHSLRGDDRAASEWLASLVEHKGEV